MKTATKSRISLTRLFMTIGFWVLLAGSLVMAIVYNQKIRNREIAEEVIKQLKKQEQLDKLQ